VFVYDHLFPMGQPERPAISCFPMLGAIAAMTGRIAIGPLVARVGLVPNAVLVNQFKTLDRMAPGRVIAAVGTGDSKSLSEHEIFGLPFLSRADRLALLEDACHRLRDAGITPWSSGGSPAVRAIAAKLGVAHNLWAVDASVVAAEPDLTITWAGPPPVDVGAHLESLAEAGATWAVYAPPPSTDWPAMVERLAVGRVLGTAEGA
jgi:alkanesulfonate monooxygenase SsuD/methylene tetrahydromethanopterin reductase-like flavin-dependent oxidoreductase (luciferase family)